MFQRRIGAPDLLQAIGRIGVLIPRRSAVRRIGNRRLVVIDARWRTIRSAVDSFPSPVVGPHIRPSGLGFFGLGRAGLIGLRSRWRQIMGIIHDDGLAIVLGRIGRRRTSLRLERPWLPARRSPAGFALLKLGFEALQFRRRIGFVENAHALETRIDRRSREIRRTAIREHRTCIVVRGKGRRCSTRRKDQQKRRASTGSPNHLSLVLETAFQRDHPIRAQERRAALTSRHCFPMVRPPYTSP